jgi:hypothetical protein
MELEKQNPIDGITVYDNVFDRHYQNDIYNFAKDSVFRIGWLDTTEIENSASRYMYSGYSHEDVDRLGILKTLKSRHAEEFSFLDECEMTRAALNVGLPTDYYFVHTHYEDFGLLYYVNMDWRLGWSGETMFFHDNMKDIIFTSPFVPNRMLMFKGKLPHAIRPQTINAPKFRFSLAMFFKRK